MIYDSILIGGGIAGLQAAIQLGRYQHRVLVIDGEEGRSVLCRSYHNILGYPNGVSGEQLRETGRSQAEQLGIEFLQDWVVKVQRAEDLFQVELKSNSSFKYYARTLLFATGVMDRFPTLPGLLPCLGLSVYICPDCDGYEVAGKRTVVMGSGEVGAKMALTLAYWTQNLVYINHEQTTIPDSIRQKLEQQQIACIDEVIERVETSGDGILAGVTLQNGSRITGEKGFIAFGGNAVRTKLAEQLGVERFENQHILSDPRTKMTNIPNVWAAGDIGVHAEQVTIAMGEGSLAAIWMHKALMQANKEQALCPN